MIRTPPAQLPSRALPQQCHNCALPAAELCRTIQKEGLPGTRAARIVKLGRDEVLVHEGDMPDFLGILRRGYLRKEKLRSCGQRRLLDLCCSGELVGGLPGKPLPFTLETATDVEICMFDRRTVERMMHDSRTFQRCMIAQISMRHDALLDMIWQLGALTSRERIIAFLVNATRIMPAEQLPDGGLVVTIELARRDWADLTNTAVETVSRTMSELNNMSLVVTLPGSRYRIRDLDRLARLAGIDTPSGGLRRTGDVPPAKSTIASVA